VTAQVSTHNSDGSALLEAETEEEAAQAKVADIDGIISMSGSVFDPQTRIVTACKNGEVDRAMDALQELLEEKRLPNQAALSALVMAWSSPAESGSEQPRSVPRALKFLQFSLQVPPQDMPSVVAVVAFLEACTQWPDTGPKLLTKIETVLGRMNGRGFVLTRPIRKAFKKLSSAVQEAEATNTANTAFEGTETSQPGEHAVNARPPAPAPPMAPAPPKAHPGSSPATVAIMSTAIVKADSSSESSFDRDSDEWGSDDDDDDDNNDHKPTAPKPAPAPPTPNLQVQLSFAQEPSLSPANAEPAAEPAAELDPFEPPASEEQPVAEITVDDIPLGADAATLGADADVASQAPSEGARSHRSQESTGVEPEEPPMSNVSGFASVRCLGCADVDDPNGGKPYVVYRLAVLDSSDGARWQVARRYSEFARMRQTMLEPVPVEQATQLDETTRNTLSTIPFPGQVAVAKVTGAVVNARAAQLHRWIRHVIRWVPREAVPSPRHNYHDRNTGMAEIYLRVEIH
jgi:hypothetical protein